jgi:3-dehydroquinate dehydratase-2
VSWIHEALDGTDGLIVNPGAWTHYSYAIRDALEIFPGAVVEVHLSNVEDREEWRRRSVIADVVTHRITGHGAEGYHEALQHLTGAGS